MIRIIFCIVAICHTYIVNAQNVIRLGIQPTNVELVSNSTPSMLISPDLTGNVDPKVIMSQISDKLITAYSTSPQFKVIDLRRTGIIAEELERQKSEEFLDGHMVEQGRKEGIDFLVFTTVDPGAKKVLALLKSIETGTTICNAEVPFLRARYTTRSADHYARSIIEQLNRRCFNITYTVVKPVEIKKGKLKTILVAAGHNKNMIKGKVLGIYTTEDVEVDGEILQRDIQIGELKIEVVEDDNFSIAEVLKGNEVVFEHLTIKKKLFCKSL
ncbi:MAG: hypothetical protein KA479_09295 [Saprospiraceae bacterium]|nr:hypothetical protein [Saprospiraceae bacterium]